MGPSAFRQTALSGARSVQNASPSRPGGLWNGRNCFVKLCPTCRHRTNRTICTHFLVTLGLFSGRYNIKKGSKQINFHDRSSINSFQELTASRLASKFLAVTCCGQLCKVMNGSWNRNRRSARSSRDRTPLKCKTSRNASRCCGTTHVKSHNCNFRDGRWNFQQPLQHWAVLSPVDVAHNNGTFRIDHW